MTDRTIASYICSISNIVPILHIETSAWCAYTIIRFVTVSAKFGICTVMGQKKTLFEAKIRTFKGTKCVLQLEQLSYLDPTVQMPNLAQMRRNGFQCSAYNYS
jgi:hypothetical protein